MSRLHRAMFTFIIVFLSSMFWPSIPSLYLLAVLVIGTALCLYHNITTWITGALIGFIWASSVGHWYSSWQLPNQYFNENVIIEGTIQTLDIPANNAHKNNTATNVPLYLASQVNSKQQKAFILRLSQIGKSSLLHKPRIRLSWFTPNLNLQQGSKVRLLVKIKRPHALANEFGFNRQKWLASQNIVAVGNVKSSPSNKVLINNTSVRQKTVHKLGFYTEKLHLKNFRWILALSLGERSLFEKQDWALLQTTGAAHLFAISGLHLGIVSLLFYNLAKSLLFTVSYLFNKNKLQTNLMPVALLVGLPFSVFYAYISGFQIPVIRATFGICLLTYLLIFQIYWRLWAILLHLLVCFFLLFPLSILSVSFWFSFGAVFAIWFFVWRFPMKASTQLETLKQSICLQLFLSLVMLPLVAFNFNFVSLISPLVNIIVLPVVSLILVPLCLLLIIAVMFDISFFINELLITLDWLFEKLITFMQAFQSVEFSTIKAMQFGYVQLCLAVVLLVFVFLPNWPNRKRIIVMLGASIALHAFTQIKFGSGFNNSAQNSNQHTQNKWSLRVFDIGQGLSVLIRQGNEFLVYDTGMAFANGGSMAANVIKPYFAANKQSAMQVTAIEYLVNSHMDNDHAGGNGFMFSHYDVKTWLSPAKGCTVKDSFVWGSLNFTVLWPLDNRTGDDNNDSCVIKVSDGEHSVLLTGDIEKEVEKELVKQHLGTNALKSDIMLAPHHGSSTSSTLPFVRAVSPKIIVISSQYYNQYRFPQSNVLRHYQDVEAEIFNTAYDGEVSFEFSRRGIHANAYRQHWLSPWYMQIQ